jgi:dynein heavy chain
MNGLKTVWIISRHYRGESKMEDLLNLISDEIADKVESHIKINELFILKEQPYDKLLQESIEKIRQGSKILAEWKK